MAFRLYSPLQLVCTSAHNSLKDSDIISALIYVLIYVLLKIRTSARKRTCRGFLPWPLMNTGVDVSVHVFASGVSRPQRLR